MHLSIILLLSLPLAHSRWVGLERLSFEEARSACYPGDLASFSTNEELSKLLQSNEGLRAAIASTNHSPAAFWIGLEKPKDLCVVSALDQRGFRFVDGRKDSELSIWREEPEKTCTNVRCGAVALDSASSWGLVSLSCKNMNSFICGPPESESRPESQPRPESTPESRLEGGARPINSDPVEQIQLILNPLRFEESPDSSSEPNITRPTFQPGLPDQSLPDQTPDKNPDQVPSPQPSPEERLNRRQDPSPHPSSHQVPDQTPASAAPSSGSGSGLSPGFNVVSHPSCPFPPVPKYRSLSLDNPGPGQVSVECWSGQILWLRCDLGAWTHIGPDPEPGPDPSPVSNVSSTTAPPLNQSEAWPGGQSGGLSCLECDVGFTFKGGKCDDVDECALSPARCAHGCVNTLGSFTCTSSPISHALMHALIAVAAVTLAVIAIVTIWCCIRKRRTDQKPDQDLNQNQTEA